MKRINGVILAVLMALSGMAFAAAGGEDNNTNCNGNGNPNSPCAGALQAVPEPGILALLGAGIVGLIVVRSRKK